MKSVPDHHRVHHEEAPFANPVLARAWAYFAKDVWRPSIDELDPLRAFYYKSARVGYLAVRGFLEDKCLFRASALTYITVLSLVPLLAFAFSVIKGLGGYEDLMVKIRGGLDAWLESEGAAASATGDSIRAALERVLGFVQSTDVTKLGTVGLVFLLIAVVQLIGTVEKSFNEIWGVKRPRSLLRKLTDYLSTVILAPIFFATAVSLTSLAEAESVAQFFRESLHLGGVIDTLLEFTSVFAMWTFFTFLFLTLPNAHTRFSSALLGGLFSGLLWHGAQILHVRFQIGMANYNKLYAGFAVIPIFLAWIHVSWVTVLAGAELAFAHQSEPAYRRIARTWPADHAFQEVVALRAIVRVTKAFLAGEERPTALTIATELGVPPRPVESALSTLAERGLVAVSEQEGEASFLPGRDPGEITIQHVLDAMRGSSGFLEVPAATKLDERLSRHLRALAAESQRSESNRSLRDLATDG